MADRPKRRFGRPTEAESLPPPPIEATLTRVKAYIAAIPTLYDDENPMHPELVLDTATNYSDMSKITSHDLTFEDLKDLVAEIEYQSEEGPRG